MSVYDAGTDTPLETGVGIIDPLHPDRLHGTGHGRGLVRGGGRLGHAHLRSHGLVARIGPIRRVTPKVVLDHHLWLPAILNSLAVTETALHTEYDTLSAGQFSQPAMGGPHVQSQLREIPIETLILAYDARWLVVTGQEPGHIRRKLAEIVRSRAPVHLLVHWHPHRGELPEVDMKVTLRQGTRTLQGGENDTHYLSFDVKEWRDARIPVLSPRPKGGRSSRKRATDLPATHKLKADDTLHSLSHEFYGSFQHWRAIRDANRIPHKWGQKTPLVKLGRYHVGSKVQIPAIDDTIHKSVRTDAVRGRQR